MNIYYFNDLNDYDIYNPSYYLDKKLANQLIFYLAFTPYSESKDSLHKKVNLSEKNIIKILDGLEFIGAISKNKYGYYKVNFPCFYEDDVKKINNIVTKDVILLVNKIKKYVINYNFTKEKLYHILCNGVFDNYAFDYLSKHGLLTNDKINKGNRNYIIIGYENSEYVNNYSKKLLCSNNKFKCKTITFNSFGDTDGDRKDFFRYFRLRQMKIKKFVNIDKYFDSIDDNLYLFKKNIEGCILKVNNDANTRVLLEDLNYIKNNEVIVPIINENEHNEIGKKIMDLIIDDISSMFDKVAKLNITANKNAVPIKDTLNEVWHILFGLINEELVRQKVVASPLYYEGEGRYLKCIYINNN